MELARDDARLVMHNDPELASERGKALRTLLYLMERDASVRLSEIRVIPQTFAFVPNLFLTSARPRRNIQATSNRGDTAMRTI